ncbi:hypothetical protein [Streptomyces siamensis]|uniref:Roadblock/LC7 domain-containing protein n=1 Tax=Streptomyces siamensis TaxID=1274986 RepID=A0ABP9IK45_9ACTN
MATIARPSAATKATPVPADQSISTFRHVEIMMDLDDGQQMLVTASDANLGDLQVVTAAQALASIETMRGEADRMEALVNEYAATVLIPQLIAAFGIELEELDTASLCEGVPHLNAGLGVFCEARKDGTFLVVVPKGQNPVQRFHFMRELVRDLQKRGQA